MAVHVAKTGRPQDAHPELLRALEIARYIEDRVMQSKILLALGTTQILLGDPEAATRRLAEAEKIAMAAGVSRSRCGPEWRRPSSAETRRPCTPY